jgi:hypothetical protein
MAISTFNSQRFVQSRRLLPAWIDQVCQEQPDKVWASITRSSDLKDRFRDIKYPEFVAAIDALAWWIESLLDRSSDFEPVVYMGYVCPARNTHYVVLAHSLHSSFPDLRYNIIFVALIKTGYQAGILQSRNAIDPVRLTNGRWYR